MSLLTPVIQHQLPAAGWLALATGSLRGARALPKPDLIIGAGHKTHASLLAAGKQTGGKTLVLMSPSLPYRLFDLCVVPEHDQPKPAANLILTQGVINRMSSTGEHLRARCLILVGGPSKHHAWDGDGLLAQISALAQAAPATEFVLTTSRRTPAGFIDQLHQLGYLNLDCIPVEQTYPGWVAEQLAASGCAWVTEDSVSMLYEALTAGVSVGALHLPRTSKNRVSSGLDRIAASGQVRWFKDWLNGEDLAPPQPFNEARRVAQWVLENWFAR